ncbi:MAG: 30S ribosomal protein S15 [Nanoarchaeota archaeon]|nr:30S ribosomal protein S15 [Nanoarchaeota archaeon]
MRKEGNAPSKVGLILRDSYGIPDVRTVLKKRITEVLAAKKLRHELPEDLLGLIRKDLSLHKHFQLNRQDMSAKRGILLTESKINRLLKYYKRTGRVPESWKYDPDKAGMYLG